MRPSAFAVVRLMNSLPWQLIWSAAKLQLSVQVRAGSPAALSDKRQPCRSDQDKAKKNVDHSRSQRMAKKAAE